jgi:hypothetical protein
MASKENNLKDGVIDLSDNATVVTESTISVDEVGAIRTIRNRSVEITNKLGQVRLEYLRIESQAERVRGVEAELLEEYKRLVDQEQDTFKSLNEKYGDGKLDLDTGTFTPTSAVTNL